jgi:hypothetical protein
MKSLKVRYKRTRGDEILSDEEYEFRLNEEGISKALVIDSMRNRDIGCHDGPILPNEWEDMTLKERAEYVESNLFDVNLKAVFFQKGTEASKEDVKILCQFPNIEELWIVGNDLDFTDIQKLTVLKHLHHLVLGGKQFGDELIDVISKFGNLRSLDVQTTSLSKEGSEMLKKVIPNECEVWVPQSYS